MQLLTISARTLSPGCSIGDIVGVFPDAHVFSANENDIFTIIPVTLTEAEINALRPVYERDLENRMVERPRFELNYSNGGITVNG
jgi:hypothetical protein